MPPGAAGEQEDLFNLYTIMSAGVSAIRTLATRLRSNSRLPGRRSACSLLIRFHLMIDEEEPFGSDVGQEESLIDRIQSLIQDHGEESVLKELLQNADDAGASWVRFTLDKRSLLHA